MRIAATILIWIMWLVICLLAFYAREKDRELSEKTTINYKLVYEYNGGRWTVECDSVKIESPTQATVWRNGAKANIIADKIYVYTP